jgi:hypothetical protein
MFQRLWLFPYSGMIWGVPVSYWCVCVCVLVSQPVNMIPLCWWRSKRKVESNSFLTPLPNWKMLVHWYLHCMTSLMCLTCLCEKRCKNMRVESHAWFGLDAWIMKYVEIIFKVSVPTTQETQFLSIIITTVLMLFREISLFIVWELHKTRNYTVRV